MYMKTLKKLVGAFTAVLCGLSTAVPLSVAAEEVPELEAEVPSTITNEKFTYDKYTRHFEVTPGLLTLQSLNERIGVVTHYLGYDDFYQDEYVVYVIEGMGSGSYAILQGRDIPVLLETHELRVGDMVRMDNWGKMTLSPPIYEPFERTDPKLKASISYLCTGEEFFGEEFNTVLRYMSTYPNLDHVGRMDDSLYTYGDVNEDGELDIIDVIMVNQFTLGNSTLDKYCMLWADVDKDGTVDSTDSLMILKEVVGLTENFQEK